MVILTSRLVNNTYIRNLRKTFNAFFSTSRVINLGTVLGECQDLGAILFITFGDKNYGNVTVKRKIQNTTNIYTIKLCQIKLSLAPLGINDCLCLIVRDAGILMCAGFVLQDLRLWP